MLQNIKRKRGRSAVYAPEQLGSTRCVLDSQQQDGLDHLGRPGHQRWGPGRPSPHDRQGEGLAAVSATLRQVDDEGRWPTNPARLKYVHATSSVRHYRLPSAAVSGAHLCLFVVGAVRLYPRICGRGGKLRSTISCTSLLGNLLGGWTRQPVRTFTSNLAVDRGGRTKPQISDPQSAQHQERGPNQVTRSDVGKFARRASASLPPVSARVRRGVAAHTDGTDVRPDEAC